MGNEEVSLYEVSDDGLRLSLLDGRVLEVMPFDITISIIWTPLTDLKISDVGSEPNYPLKVTVLGSDETVRARWSDE